MTYLQFSKDGQKSFILSPPLFTINNTHSPPINPVLRAVVEVNPDELG